MAAITAAGRMIDAVKGRQNIERSIDAAADLDDLPRPPRVRRRRPNPDAAPCARKINGVCVSAISTGVPRTPLG